MCKCLKDLNTCLSIYVILSFVARFILGLLITIFTKFEGEILFLSIFSLLNSIALFTTIIFFVVGYSNGDTYSYKSGGYTYTVTIDTSKEDPEQTRKRYNTMDFCFKNGMRIGYISLIFAIGTIEEYFRVGGKDQKNDEYYITFIIVTIFELIFIVLLLFSNNYNK